MLSAVLLATVTVGCNNGNKPQADSATKRNEPAAQETAAKPAPTPAPTPEVPPPTTASGQQLPDPLTGTVKETMNSGGYTYVLVDTPQGDVWAAARQFPVAVGNEVQLAGLMPMVNFSSKSLQRTFDVIQFVGQAQVVGGAAPGQAPQIPPGAQMPPGHPPINQAPAPKAGEAAAPAAPVEALEGGVTVEQLFDQKADLAGKTVKFRGRVVKANSGIMGKNWLHVQDGTGTAAAASNDITVTSETGFAPVGSVVVIEGTVALNRDFGAGYSYAVIVENAKVTVEPEDGKP